MLSDVLKKTEITVLSLTVILRSLPCAHRSPSGPHPHEDQRAIRHQRTEKSTFVYVCLHGDNMTLYRESAQNALGVKGERKTQVDGENIIVVMLCPDPVFFVRT